MAEAIDENDATAHGLNRRALLQRLAATSAVAWAAPEVLATRHARAMALSGCHTTHSFEDGLGDWTATHQGGARWQASSLQSSSGSQSAWFGRASSSDSLHPTIGQPSYNGGRSRGTLTSPATTVSSTDMISFDLRLAIENAAAYDVFRFFIVQGGVRRQLWDKHAGGFAVIDHPEFPVSQWGLYTTNGAWVNISLTVGTPDGIDLVNPVQFEFDFQTVDNNYNKTEGIYIDNFAMPCPTGSLASPQASGPGGGVEVDLSSAGLLPGYQSPAAVSEPSKRLSPEQEAKLGRRQIREEREAEKATEAELEAQRTAELEADGSAEPESGAPEDPANVDNVDPLKPQPDTTVPTVTPKPMHAVPVDPTGTQPPPPVNG